MTDHNKKPKQGMVPVESLLGELKEASGKKIKTKPQVSLQERWNKLNGSKIARYAALTAIGGLVVFSAVRFIPPAYEGFESWRQGQAIQTYQAEFAKVQNYVIAGQYETADSLITSLEQDMSEDISPGSVSLLEDIARYDHEVIDPPLHATQTEMARPTSTQTKTLTPTITNTPTITLTPTDTLTSAPSSTYTITPTFTLTATNTRTPTSTLTFTPTRTSTPTITPTFTKSPTKSSTPYPTADYSVPLRTQIHTTIGSGVLSDVTYSDGMAVITQSTLDQPLYWIQLINKYTTSDQCGVARYNVSIVWFADSAPTDITVNGKVIGSSEIATGNHGYLFKYPLKIGDKICATAIQPSGFHFYFGPTIYQHYDSYCFRGYC